MSGKRRAAGPPTTKKPQKPKRTTKQKLKRAGVWALVAGLVSSLLAVAGFVVLYQTIDVPDPNEDFETQTTFVYYSDGKNQLGQFATQNRESIPLDEMPQSIQDAVVAAENRSFWTDSGLDPKGILRAAFSNAQGNATQGASTITQQYVKILYLTQERTLERKLKEAFLSLKIHRQQSKSEILEGYLNTIYFGRGAYGIQAASKAFFDVEAKDLNLRQSAVLATVLNNPTAYDPANGKQAKRDLKERYGYVLRGMADTGAISADQADKAAKRLPKFPEIQKESQYGGQRGHVLNMVRKELIKLGFSEDEIEGGGLQVTTTFTKKHMQAAEQGVLEARPEGFKDKELHVGVASVEPGTGAVRGIYGGQDYLDSQINWAVAGGQAGSTMKPAALVAAIEDGFSLKDTFEGNSPLVLPDGTDFENQGDTDYGSAISMVDATENSVNTAFIDMTTAMENGPKKIVDAANRLGIPPAKAPSRRAPGFPSESPGLEPILGVSLGNATVSPINMANAYATLANEGRAAEPYIIEKVVDRTGETRYQHKVSDSEAVEPDIAADVSYALQQVVQSGSGTAAQALGRPAAGKTGTATNGLGEVSSAWFTGYTPQLSTAVMYVRGKGNEQLQGWLPSYFGGAYPAETWTAVMQRAMEGLPIEEFPPPAYVDGEAPTSGHEPYTPPPSPTKQPSPSKTPSQKPTEEPSEEPSETKPPQPTPTDDCQLLQNCPSESPSPSGSSSPTNGSSTGPGGGNGGGNNGRRRVGSQE
ncbi:transglycosylase domain-containing protein [Nocardioides sp. GCM10027113]|uniref:transglycosylase domain-containing protein n=1 Tax=unclassified Nocardioides TaxID=2615069 RepID=UPI00360D7095